MNRYCVSPAKVKKATFRAFLEAAFMTPREIGGNSTIRGKTFPRKFRHMPLRSQGRSL